VNLFDFSANPLPDPDWRADRVCQRCFAGANAVTSSPPTDDPDYTAMGAALTSACGDDALKWATAFVQHYRKGFAGGIDEGLMVGWSANAIEASAAVRRRNDAANGWISVEERLPEPSPHPWLCRAWSGRAGHVIDGHCIADFTFGKWHGPFGEDVTVTHWRPLPEPPK
jgi:hypothetical protein